MIFRWIAFALALLASCVFASEEEELHEWEADLHAPTKWHPLHLTEIPAKPDASAKDGRLEFQATSTLRGITAFRVELTPAEQGNSTGKATLFREFQVIDYSDKPTPLALELATASIFEKDKSTAAMIDGDLKTHWLAKRSSTVSYQLLRPVLNEGMQTFRFVIFHEGLKSQRIKMHATTRPRPVIELSDSVKETLALEPSERSDEQRAELLALFRATRRAAGKAR
jgi:hypothetical protein